MLLYLLLQFTLSFSANDSAPSRLYAACGPSGSLVFMFRTEFAICIGPLHILEAGTVACIYGADDALVAFLAGAVQHIYELRPACGTSLNNFRFVS